MSTCDVGLAGLAVMGRNLALNMARNGFRVAVYNRSPEKTHEFMASSAHGTSIAPAFDLPEFVASLSRPRRIVLMVKAGEPVDKVIESLVPLLDQGDILLDCGNSLYTDTERRARELKAKGLRFLGVGVSGGEEGALWGPSIMPGGDREAFDLVAPLLAAVAAKHQGEPCMAYMGREGAGHFVKMVHNGIEYGDMQLIAEAYDLLRRGLGLEPTELARIFEDWNKGSLASYLIEITAEILLVKDPESGGPLLDVILDRAGQKGTGRWTTKSALDLGVAVPTITAAVDGRILSDGKDQREQAARILPGPVPAPPSDSMADTRAMIDLIRDGLYGAKLCSYAQGFALLAAADKAFGYGINAAAVAGVWRAGCIIRARFLDEVTSAFEAEPHLPNLLLAPGFRAAMDSGQAALRRVVAAAVAMGAPTPAMGASLAYYDGLRSARLPANLIQAQRDYFGAHTYKRVDRPGVFHTQWQDQKDNQ